MNDFTSGNSTKQILLFSLPMLVGNLFQQLYSMVDAVVVGRYVGGTALAAVGVSMQILQFLVASLIGLTTGASVLISQFYGAHQYDKLRRMVSTSVIFLGGLSVLIAGIGITLSPSLLRLLNAEPAIMEPATLYLRLLMVGMVFPIFYNMYTAYLRALGDSRSPLYILIFCTVLNTGLDLLFVTKLDMGVLGVAVATVIAQFLSAILCYVYTKKRVELLRIQTLAFDGALFLSVLRYGAPAAMQLSLVSLASLSITRLINTFGTAAMAGITVATKIDQLALMPVSNVGMALATFVAQNMGAGLEERARKGLRSTLVMMTGLSLGISAIIVRTAPWLVPLFLRQEDTDIDQIMQVGLRYLSVLALFYFLHAILFAFNGFFRGVGDAVIAMAFPVSSLAIRTIAAHYLMQSAGMGPEALAWSVPIGWAVTSFASFVYYRKNLWVGKVLQEAHTADPVG